LHRLLDSFLHYLFVLGYCHSQQGQQRTTEQPEEHYYVECFPEQIWKNKDDEILRLCMNCNYTNLLFPAHILMNNTTIAVLRYIIKLYKCITIE